MEVILKKNVDKLGYANEIVNVKPGYGRNFLIPQGYASLATASAKRAHEEMMKQKAHKENKLELEAQEIWKQEKFLQHIFRISLLDF